MHLLYVYILLIIMLHNIVHNVMTDNKNCCYKNKLLQTPFHIMSDIFCDIVVSVREDSYQSRSKDELERPRVQSTRIQALGTSGEV